MKSLREAIFLDQLLAVRKTVYISLPVNIILGLAVLLVASHSGKAAEGGTWFAASFLVNLVRLALCRFPVGRAARGRRPFAATLRRHVVAHCALALLSGLAWAMLPLLCDGFTSPQTLFYLTVICGITAGAVTHGFAFAVIPISFITPPLVSVATCLS